MQNLSVLIIAYLALNVVGGNGVSLPDLGGKNRSAMAQRRRAQDRPSFPSASPSPRPKPDENGDTPMDIRFCNFLPLGASFEVAVTQRGIRVFSRLTQYGQCTPVLGFAYNTEERNVILIDSTTLNTILVVKMTFFPQRNRNIIVAGPDPRSSVVSIRPQMYLADYQNPSRDIPSNAARMTFLHMCPGIPDIQVMINGLALKRTIGFTEGISQDIQAGRGVMEMRVFNPRLQEFEVVTSQRGGLTINQYGEHYIMVCRGRFEDGAFPVNSLVRPTMRPYTSVEQTTGESAAIPQTEVSKGVMALVGLLTVSIARLM